MFRKKILDIQNTFNKLIIVAFNGNKKIQTTLDPGYYQYKNKMRYCLDPARKANAIYYRVVKVLVKKLVNFIIFLYI